MTNLSIIIPVYNESGNIKKLISEIHTSMSESYTFEVIVVDDGSIDDSNYLINELQNKKLVKLIEHKKNLGQSHSILTGIKESKYDTIVTIDGDGQNNPFNIPELLNVYFSTKGVALVNGIRKNRKDSMIKVLSSKIANKVRSLILNDGCPDTGCSLKVFNKDIFLKFPYFDGIHRFLPALFKGFGYKIQFVIVDHNPRIYGISKYGILNRLFKGIFDLIRVKKIINRYKINND